MLLQVTPSWGWILMYEYTCFFFLLLFGKYLHVAWASHRNGHGIPYPKVCTKSSHSHCAFAAVAVGSI